MGEHGTIHAAVTDAYHHITASALVCSAFPAANSYKHQQQT